MPRTARIKSSSGVYHIMLRGNNKQQIFYEDEDFHEFYAAINRFRDICGYKIHGWCLMPNHIHLVIQEKQVPLSQAMQKIVISFVFWYNRKYDRVGHLFQDRFRSEPIESADYFLKAIRYIHMNPVHGGLCESPEKYAFSSYNYYFSSGKYQESDLIFNLIRKDEFRSFHFEKNEDEFIDLDTPVKSKLSDADFSAIVRENSACKRSEDIKFLPESERKRLIQILLRHKAEIPQISRLTGLTVNEIRRFSGNQRIAAQGIRSGDRSPD